MNECLWPIKTAWYIQTPSFFLPSNTPLDKWNQYICIPMCNRSLLMENSKNCVRVLNDMRRSKKGNWFIKLQNCMYIPLHNPKSETVGRQNTALGYTKLVDKKWEDYSKEMFCPKWWYVIVVTLEKSTEWRRCVVSALVNIFVGIKLCHLKPFRKETSADCQR